MSASLARFQSRDFCRMLRILIVPLKREKAAEEREEAAFGPEKAV